MTNTILIADDDADIVDLLTRRCQQLGFNVDSASNAMTALGKIEKNQPDAVILDVDMPQGSGLSVCEMMVKHEELQIIPVIMLTGSTTHDTVRRCHELCAYYVPKGPDVWSRVEPILRDLFDCNDTGLENTPQEIEFESDANKLEGPTDLMDTVFAVLGVEEGSSMVEDEPGQTEQRSDKPWVLSIEDDDDIALALRLRLQEFGVQVIRADAGTEGYRRAFLDSPRAIILDYELPQGNGDYVLRRLKESPVTCDIPVIVLTGRREASIERQMRSLGASEFLTKPLDWKRLRAALQLNLDESQESTHIESPEKTLA